MSTRATTYDAQVLSRARISEHLTRLVLGGPALAAFESTRQPDEWVGLVVPGQFQSRYYTVRSWQSGELTIDIAMHDVGLVTEWAAGECVGETVSVTEPKGSFVLPDGARWVILVGDLTALPAMSRIAAEVDLPVHVWAEVPDDLSGYLPACQTLHWLDQPGDGASALASVVESLDWPAGDGYFWMAGESAQMRAIRKHLMRDRRLPSTAYDVMGYWRGVSARQPRAVDPAPTWRTDHDEQRTT